MKTVVFEGIQFVLGQSATENWTILAAAQKDYTWAHLDDYASAHVIIETEDPTARDLEFARQLILEQTKKAPAHAKLITAPVKSVKRGSKPGEVIIKPSKGSK
jgi:predicted ribosome quality control (RQC) complex YloA/Tae2 family protein